MTTRQLIMAASTNVLPGSSGGGGNGGGTPIDPTQWLAYIADHATTENLCHGIDTDGNSYLAGGYTEEFTNNWGSYVIKINTLGEFQWFMVLPEEVSVDGGIPAPASADIGSRALGSGTFRSFEPCAITSNKEGSVVYLTGYSEDNYNDYNTVIALDTVTGNILWQTSFGFDWGTGAIIEGGYPHAIKADSLGNLYVVGWTLVGNRDRAFIAKLNSLGSVLYTKLFGHSTSYYLEFFDIQVLESQNALLVCGTTYTTRGCGYLAKYDLEGTLIWQTDGLLLNDNTTCFYSLTTDAEGNIYVAVDFWATEGQSIGLIKFDSSGLILWKKGLGNNTHGLGYPNCIIDKLGNIMLMGSADNETYGTLFAYFAPDGSILWHQYLKKLYNSLAGSTHLSIDRSGNIYTGHTWRNDSGYYVSFATKRSSDAILDGNYTVGPVTLVVVSNLAVQVDEPSVRADDPRMINSMLAMWVGPAKFEIRTEALLTYERVILE